MSKYRQSGLYPFFMAMILFGLTACIMKEHVHCSIEDYHPHQKIILPQNKTIVVVGGCFDILHYGHIRFLEEAYKAGGTNAYLVVALEPDSRKSRTVALFMARNVNRFILNANVLRF